MNGDDSDDPEDQGPDDEQADYFEDGLDDSSEPDDDAEVVAARICETVRAEGRATTRS